LSNLLETSLNYEHPPTLSMAENASRPENICYSQRRIVSSKTHSVTVKPPPTPTHFASARAHPSCSMHCNAMHLHLLTADRVDVPFECSLYRYSTARTKVNSRACPSMHVSASHRYTLTNHTTTLCLPERSARSLIRRSCPPTLYALSNTMRSPISLITSQS
jgi:hypothetical protein